jgi:hypothetical protein
MSHLPDYVGWAATAIFLVSYFCDSPVLLRLLQGSASLIWIIYGVMIGSLPVVGANILVFLAAIISLWKSVHFEIEDDPEL